MQSRMTFLGAALILVAALSSVSGQAGGERVGENAQDISQNKSESPTLGPVTETSEANLAPVPLDEPPIWVYLVGGRRMQVNEVTESAEAFGTSAVTFRHSLIERGSNG